MENKTVNALEKVLECKDLRISFKTNNGTVKAVRGVSFNLYRGRTLAIVGESGSGKSVTSKAIMGILAGNKIIEDGHILFDGHDLLRLSDRQFTDIRGSRISMIFQDPMSSLNPIMRVGKQMTEALILKNGSVRENSLRVYKTISKYLLSALINAEDIDKKRVESIFKTMHKDIKSLSESDRQYLLSVFPKTINTIENNYLSSIKSLLVKLTTAKEKYLSSLDSFSRDEFKQYIASLSNIKIEADDPLSEEKNDFAFTFQPSLRAALKKLADAEANLISDKKMSDLIANKKAKGINTAKIELKIRSFGSEITLTPQNVFDQIRGLFDEFIENLEDILANRNILDAQQKSIDVLDLLAKKQADSRFHLSSTDATKKAIKILEEVGIANADKRFRQYPFELSGGMRQRIVIAIALLADPDILICDEPTTALDVTIQAQILDLINKIKAERNLSIIFITHNLGVVANMADDIAVMYAGKIVEYGGSNDIFYNSKHPYTWALLSSMPDLNKKERLDAIPGTPPNMIIPPRGDAFAPRNKYALKLDYEEEPPFFPVSENHYAATWLLHPDAPQVVPPKVVIQRIEDLKRYRQTLSKNEVTKHGKK